MRVLRNNNCSENRRRIPKFQRSVVHWKIVRTDRNFGYKRVRPFQATRESFEPCSGWFRKFLIFFRFWIVTQKNSNRKFFFTFLSAYVTHALDYRDHPVYTDRRGPAPGPEAARARQHRDLSPGESLARFPVRRR